MLLKFKFIIKLNLVSINKALVTKTYKYCRKYCYFKLTLTKSRFSSQLFQTIL